jgi:hypothetical protein
METKFKIDDIVKVRRKDSEGSRLMHGKIGKVVGISSTFRHDLHKEINYYILDIDTNARGIWEYELSFDEKKKIKPYGIVKFMNSLEKNNV